MIVLPFWGSILGYRNQDPYCLTEETLYATIGELAAGKKSGDISENERILCVPIGTGAMDIAVAAVASRRAREKGLGGYFKFV